MSDGDFLSRWSRRKLAAKTSPERATVADVSPRVGSPSPVAVPPPALPPSAPAEPAAALPPVESLTPESDFTPFMKPEVDGSLRRQALRTLFRDPRFNVMDGLDVYIDDYSKPDPLPEGWLEKMNQVARLGDYRPPEAAAEEAAERPVATEGEADSRVPSPEESPPLPETPRPEPASNTPDDQSCDPQSSNRGDL